MQLCINNMSFHTFTHSSILFITFLKGDSMIQKKLIACLILISPLLAQAHDFKRIIVFGDSLVDSGTYAAVAGPKGGGKFTINPGQNWTENLATQLGLKLTTHRQEGFNLPVQIIGGLNFAQGGARVSQNPGSGVDKGYTARSLKDQVQLFKESLNSFHKSDLVIVAGGGIDVVLQVNLLAAQQMTLEQAIKNIDQASTDLALIVKSIKENGNPTILVPTLPDISLTPLAQESGPKAVQLFSKLTEHYNQGILKKIKGVLPKPIVHGLKIQIVRIDKLDQFVTNHPEHYGITDLKTPACATNLLPGGSALFCNEKTLISASAQSFKFADKLHPTPLVHKIIADHVFKQITKKDVLY